jgi:choline dehydrogenase
VLVIEYGPLDQKEPSVLVPGLLNLTSSPYFFNRTSIPQRGLNNRTFQVPAAAVVGGGTVVNGIFFDRGAAADYDAWEEIGNPGWGWDDLLPYFKKVFASIKVLLKASCEHRLTLGRAKALNQQFKRSPKNLTYHGIFQCTGLVDQYNQATLSFNGHRSVCVHQPIITSLSEQTLILFLCAEYFFRGWNSLGVRTPKDPGAGIKSGVFWAPSSLDPRDKTRSYARTAHYDRVVGSRPNYHLLTNSAVQRIAIKNGKASAVEFIDRASMESHSVKVKREIILAAGSVHSPQILQLSGIGPKDVMRKLRIEPQVDLPGVGQNFQDHPTLYPVFGSTSLSQSSFQSAFTAKRVIQCFT